MELAAFTILMLSGLQNIDETYYTVEVDGG